MQSENNEVGSVLRSLRPRPQKHYDFLYRVWSAMLKSIFFITVHAFTCYAAQVVIVNNEGSSYLGMQVALAARFYGLDVQNVKVNEPAEDRRLENLLAQDNTVAAIVSAEALPFINRHRVITSLKRRSGEAVPLLIVEPGRQSDSAVLAAWSGGLIKGCRPLMDRPGKWHLPDPEHGLSIAIG